MSDQPTTHAPIVVGVDGREPSRTALDWAVDEAARRRLPLRIRYAAPDGLPQPPTLAAAPDGDTVLDEALARARELAPTVEVDATMVVGPAATVLIEASKDAALLVVGARGRGALASALLGSTSVDVAAHAHCPVAVVRSLPTARPDRPGVVVGSDGSERSDAAVAVAFAEADARGLPLTLVHTWYLDHDAAALAVVDTTDLRRALAEEAQTLGTRAVSGWAEKYPDVEVRLRVLGGHPVEVLVDQSDGAELVVVGSRGRGGFAGLLLGSVSQGVLHQARCPVMVVRPSSTDQR